MERAAIYARVSTDMQRDNFSIPSQIAECVKHAKKRGYTVVADQFVNSENGYDALSGDGSTPAYVDDYSSRELSRPGLDAALRYLEVVGYDVLIVHALDRLARDPYIRQTLEREFSTRGAKVEYVLGSYEETPEGEVRKDLDATFAKWENAKRVERCNRGKCRKAESGLFVTGKSPFGYRWDKNAPAGLAVDEQQAAVVQKIFDLYVHEGFSIHQIIMWLEGNGVPSHSGNHHWGSTSVNRILKNPTYTGHAFYNKTKLLPSYQREVRDQSNWIDIPTTPIVEDWIFQEAQKRFLENKERKRRMPSRFYMLTGMVICDHCKRLYVTQTYASTKQRRKTERQIYRHRINKGHCSNHSIGARELESIVWREIVSILEDPDRLRQGYEASMEQYQASYARQKAHVETLKNKAEKLEQSKVNLTEAYIDPDIRISRDDFIAQKVRIESELKTINKEMEAMGQEMFHVPTPAELQCLEAYAAKICHTLDTIDPSPEEKRTILQLLHVEVVVDLEGFVRLEGWFTPVENGGLLDRQS
jgi:site-specific DNA recombinase